MSSSFRCDNDYAVDVGELLQIGTMCRELRKEKDMLRESLLREKSKNAELIQRLESKANAVSEAHLKDRKHIEELEREMRNCTQEIGYLQDQLNLRNIEANCMGEHVHSLELKLAEVGKLYEKLNLLSEELVHSDSQRLFLMRELKRREEELQNSALHLGKLETAVSSIALESECELESMKLDITALEQRCFEAESFSQQAAQEKARMDALLEEFEFRIQEAQQMINYLEKENIELQQKLVTSKRNGSFHKIEEHLNEWLKHNSRMGVYLPSESNQASVKLDYEFPLSKEMCLCEEVLGPFLSKLAVVTARDENVKDEMEKMSNQIRESEFVVKQLKEELREEKVKAKEEAEDLIQEMAELRYQITGMLEEECKRRASIEQASLQRIQELEAQVRQEQKKSLAIFTRFREVHELAEMRAMEIRHLKNELEGFRLSTDLETAQRIESCSCGNCVISQNSHICSEAVDAEVSNTCCKISTSQPA